jgi:signal transduction histidine kinase
MFNQSRTSSASTETIVPLTTAVNLLRIMLTIKILPDVVSLLTQGLGAGLPTTLILLTSWPTMLVWLFVMLPGIDRRLSRYYLQLILILTIAAQAIEIGLLAYAFPPRPSFFRALPFDRGAAPYDVRGLEPLFLLLVSTVIASWAYGRRGAWRTTGLVTVLLLIGDGPDLLSGSVTRSLAETVLRVALVLLVGLIVGTLAEQERNQTLALQTANAKLREQTAAVDQLATARERNRLARDLHDTLAHSLAGLVVQLEAIDTLMQAEPDAAQSELRTAQQLAQAGLQETRQAIRDLRVSPIEDLGLERALRRMVTDFGERAGVKVDLRISEPKTIISTDTAEQIFRIAQEALHNVELHAGAQQVNVRLTQVDHSIMLGIADDGRGFDSTQIGDERFGLTGMRERAEMIGAELKIESQVGQGTQIWLTLPLAGSD